ncbi:N-acetylmuramoyl-L-alanine amidase [Nesterenkonia sp. HG001]|uniref:peptidoglycan recognition protein family protein n=1 Tax=Nesterenkonia sp. HG001 TaxID=2983207 RepID=UPI002AC4EFE5|nr:N-acetylmuramoyl-L-alanine amidase [Nesterenkonia sp. HG001]MDZ5077857.1 peptidoglycan-binding domain-containing protein [Nesterenkonia sp. HG001]
MFLTGLDRLLRDADVPFRTQDGWQTRTAHSGGLTEVRAVMWHTTETSDSTFRASSSDAPTLNYTVRGLGYPLYGILIGRDGTAHIIAAGTAGHAGRGSGFGMPRDNANRYSVGVSFDANGSGHPVTAAQLETGARIGAAFDEEWRGEIRHVMHGEWAPTRRTDPTGVDWEKLRAAIDRGRWATDAAAGGGTQPAPSAPSASEDFLVGGSRVPVHPAATRDRDPIGHVGAGHAIRRDPSRDTPGWFGVGDHWFVHRSEVEGTDADTSAGLYVGQWPGRALPGRDAHTWESHYAWVELLARVGYDDDDLTEAIQRWLDDLGEDVGPADGDFGERTTAALQDFLTTRDHYAGLIDGVRGPMTIGAELAYLNAQLRHLDSKWPQHARAPRINR